VLLKDNPSEISVWESLPCFLSVPKPGKKLSFANRRWTKNFLSTFQIQNTRLKSAGTGSKTEDVLEKKVVILHMAYRFDQYNTAPQRTEQEQQEETIRQILDLFFSSDRAFADRQPPTSPLAIDELDIIQFDDDKTVAKYKSENCPVCTDTFKKGQEARKLPCKHVFHDDCIIPWLEKHNTCPLCRYKLPTLDAHYEATKRNGGKDDDEDEEEEDVSKKGKGGEKKDSYFASSMFM